MNDFDTFNQEFCDFLNNLDSLGINIHTVNGYHERRRYLIHNNQLSYYKIADFRDMLNKHYESYYSKLEQNILDSSFIKLFEKIGIDLSPRDIIINSLVQILEESLNNQNKLMPWFQRKDDEFNDITFYLSGIVPLTKDLYDLVSSDKINLIIICMLQNVRINSEFIRLTDTTIIRKITDLEQRLFLDESTIFRENYDPQENTILEIRCQLNDNISEYEFQKYLDYKLLDILGSIRIKFGGDINCNAICIKTNSSLNYPSIFRFFENRPSNSRSLVNSAELISTYPLIVNGKINDSIRTAFERFNIGKSRDVLADKVVDFSISFESLFTNPEFEGKESIGYKLSSRVARLMSTDSSSRKLIGKQIKIFYTNRSNIVHSNKEDQNIISNILTSEEYLRKAILIYILEGTKDNKNNSDGDEFHQKFLNRIDFR